MTCTEHVEILYRSCADSPLGKLSWAGVIKNSEGTGYPQLRQFGRYALVHVLAGGGHYQDADGHSCVVNAGDMILVLPERPHRYGPGPGQFWDEIYLVFEGPVFDLWGQTGLFAQRQPVFASGSSAYWHGRLRRVIEQAKSRSGDSALQQVCELQRLLAELLPHEASEAADDERRWLSQARQLLQDQRLSLREVAEQLGLNYDCFRKRFTRLGGCSPARYRSERAIDRVAELLRHSDRPLREIAQALGYCDEFHLSRRFQHLRGVSPREFRRGGVATAQRGQP